MSGTYISLKDGSEICIRGSILNDGILINTSNDKSIHIDKEIIKGLIAEAIKQKQIEKLENLNTKEAIVYFNL